MKALLTLVSDIACQRLGNFTLRTEATPWREIESDYLTIDGHMIPKGCDVATCVYSIHHNETYFPQSYTFLPDRWLQGNSIQVPEPGNSAWVPFMLGSRICPGRELSGMAVSDILALLVWHLDFCIPSEEPLAAIGGGSRQANNGRHQAHEFQL